MQILLLDDVESVGRIGEVMVVANGYANNFLIPKGLAIRATKANKKIVEQKQQQAEKKYKKRLDNSNNKKAQLESLKLEIARKAGKSGKLFGSITNSDIKDMIARKGYDVDKKRIVVPKAIKSVGEYTITVKIYGGVRAEIPLTVTYDTERSL